MDRLHLADQLPDCRGARGAGLRDGAAEELAQLLEEVLLAEAGGAVAGCGCGRGASANCGCGAGPRRRPDGEPHGGMQA